MKEREVQIKCELDSGLINRKCMLCDKQKRLEEAEKTIVNVIFEEQHGKNLIMQDVIFHIENLQKNLGKENCLEVNEMLDGLNSFKEYLIQTKLGSKGERFVNEALEKIPGERVIFSNLEVNKGSKSKTELDNVVITSKGIFIIETKWRNSDCYISKEGNLFERWQKYATFETINILDDLYQKKYIVRELLAEGLGHKDSSQISKMIHPVIVWANRYSSLEDRSKSATIKYCYNIAQYIEDYDDGTIISDEEMKKISKVMEKWTDKELYDIGFDLEGLRERIIRGLPLLEEKKEEAIIQATDLSTNQNALAEKIIEGTIGVGLVAFLGYQIGKRLIR